MILPSLVLVSHTKSDNKWKIRKKFCRSVQNHWWESKKEKQWLLQYFLRYTQTQKKCKNVRFTETTSMYKNYHSVRKNNCILPFSRFSANDYDAIWIINLCYVYTYENVSYSWRDFWTDLFGNVKVEVGFD